MTNSNPKTQRYGFTLAGILLLFSFISIISACSGKSAVTKPNILLIILDDFGYNDLALNNGSDSPTPTLDQIAQQGLRFSRHYTESSCTPSRVALLTGMYPTRVGAHPDLAGIDHELTTLPETLSQGGYTNYMIGKWHAGDSHRESRPEYHGFDHWLGFMSQLYLMGPHTQDQYLRKKPTYKNPWLENEKGELKSHKGHLTNILTDHALEVIRTEENSWFMYLSYYAPHTPIQPDKKFTKKHPKTPAGAYQALIDQLDSNLKRIFSELEATGKLENTMVVIVSDNGGTTRHWPNNLPFNGTKATYTEGGVRTPLILHWPAGWPVRQQSDQIVAIFDLYPTIVSALGLTPPENLDGVDLFSDHKPRELKWYSHGHGIMGDRYSSLSADGHWRMTAWENVLDTLENEADFVAQNPPNRASAHPEMTQTMKEATLRWAKSATQVTNLSTTLDKHWASFTGQAFRRTPLSGTHTLGITLRRGETEEGEEPLQQLITQDNYININASPDVLELEFDGHHQEITLPATGQCMTLLITSAMSKNNMIFYRKEARSQLGVYINGALIELSTYDNPILNKASPKSALRVNISPKKHWYMPSGAQPFLSTRAINRAEIETEVEPLLRKNC